MAIKKSQLYNILWNACNELRGGMDASQYKDYVLVVLFLKYISDKAKSDPKALTVIPKGCSFDDVLEHTFQPTICEKVTTSLEKIAEANPSLQGVINTVDFGDEQKLGKGKDLIETVSKLLKVFQNDNLDFSNNRAADDDLIGDAYEYLMRKFASQSGKSKGQFYTPAEVSRVMANIIGISKDLRPRVLTVYDPTCGSGSLLLRARAEALRGNVSLDGQEKDLATIGMAKMSMIIHGDETAVLEHGDTLNNPLHKENENTLTQFDYVVANPPFSVKNWMKSAKAEDTYGRWGTANGLPPVPPNNCGDYAFLLHIIASLRPDGHAACILPHGVLFRGNDEANIREWLIRHHLISGIIGLPPNLFYGTGIPACIIIIDKLNALESKGIFMIDAKEGFEKDGDKNRLREMDIRRIEDAWNAHEDIPHYARFVPYEEISDAKNNFNLNLPRYIAPVDSEIQQDITAHLHGNIPAYDVEEVFSHYWQVCPTLKEQLFTSLQNGYYHFLKDDASEICEIIDCNEDYKRHSAQYRKSVGKFFDDVIPEMKALPLGFNPKEKIEQWGNALLKQAEKQELVNPYEAYEVLRVYWAETMQDDCYLISRDGWKVEVSTEKKKPTHRDILCDLLPVDVLVNKFFSEDEVAVANQEAVIEKIASQITEMEEENPQELDDSAAGIKLKLEMVSQPAPLENEEKILAEFLPLLAIKGKEGKVQQAAFIDNHKDVFDQLDKVNKASVAKRLKIIPKYDTFAKETVNLFTKYIELQDKLSEEKDKLKALLTKIYEKVRSKYDELSEDDIRHLVVDCKWRGTIMARADSLLSEVNQKMTTDLIALRDRYAHTLPSIETRVNDLRSKVNESLAAMGIKR